MWERIKEYLFRMQLKLILFLKIIMFWKWIILHIYWFDLFFYKPNIYPNILYVKTVYVWRHYAFHISNYLSLH